MILRLDPRHPLVWRTPDTLQIGIDEPLAIITDVSPGLEKVVAALRGGVPETGALMLGERAGLPRAHVTDLLRALAPALLGAAVTTASPVDGPRRHPGGGRGAGPGPGAGAGAGPGPGPGAGGVCVDGSGPTADRIRALLADLDTRVDAAAEHDTVLAVIVGHFVLEPERHGRWLRRDVPHLPVIFGDRRVRIGPFVRPGDGPCLSCVELARVDADSAWPAIAVQLLSRAAMTETPRMSIEVATRVACLVQDHLAGAATRLMHGSVTLDEETGAVMRSAHRRHARCGCRSLPGSETVPGVPAAGRRLPPS